MVYRSYARERFLLLFGKRTGITSNGLRQRVNKQKLLEKLCMN